MSESTEMSENKRVISRAGAINPPKKIFMLLYLSRPSTLPPLYNGGISLARAGYSVEVLCITDEMERTKEETIVPGFVAKRFTLYSREILYKLFGGPPKNFIRASIQYLSSYAEFVLKATIRAYFAKGDLYEAHDLPTLLPSFLASKLRRKPLVYHAHELYPEMHGNMRFSRLWKLLERILTPRADLVVSPEENRSNIYLEEYHAKGMPLLIRNCPPFKEPVKSSNLSDYLKSFGVKFKTIVLYQGLLDYSRCIEEMIDSAKYFSDGNVLVLLGGGKDEWAEPGLMKEFPKNVVHIPYVPYPQLVAYTSSADVGILFYRNTCRNNYYCAPNKLFEYMMMGLPVITNDYPGIKKFVEGENVGLCANPENPFDVARAVDKLASNPDLYQEMKSNCLRLSREVYNWETEFKKLQEAYNTMLHQAQDD